MSEVRIPPQKRPFDTYNLHVATAEDLTPRVKGLRFEILDGKRMAFKAGQFVQIFVKGEDGSSRRTSYSIASSPQHMDFFELCVTLVEGGESSTFLHALETGETLQAMGPLGRFTLPEKMERDIVFVATGSGIAPFRSMIQDLIDRKTSRAIYLVFGNRYEDDIIYRGEWEQLARERKNFKPLLVLSRGRDGWNGANGYVQDHVGGFVPDVKTKDFYICGLVKMIDAVKERLLSSGAQESQIHIERYD